MAEAPLIEAENLFRQPGPPQMADFPTDPVERKNPRRSVKQASLFDEEAEESALMKAARELAWTEKKDEAAN